MRKKWFLLVLLALPIAYFLIPTDNQVKSKAYEKLLKTMLKHDVTEISIAELAQLNTSYVVLDARERNEYDVSHFKNALHVGYKKFDLAKVSHLQKNDKIVVYCSMGMRSEKIARKLIENGFLDVSNLYGGLFEWKNQDHTVYNGEQETEEVHAYGKMWGIWLTNGTKVYN